MTDIVGSKKQLEYWNKATHRWNFKVGATRSGKTYMDYFLIPRRIAERKGKEGLYVILGNTRETVNRNIIVPMQNIYGTSRVGNISKGDNTCKMFGETVYCLGADNVSHADKIRGTSIKYCYGDEVATWSQEVFDMLKSRLDKSYSQFDGALNPQGPNHWLKDFLDSDADIYQQHYTIFDNPFLPKEVVENICKEYAGTVYYQRYVLGNWALAEGLIYPMYESAIAEPPDSEPEQRFMSIDYGTRNAFAALLWGKYGGVWHVEREYYYSGRDEGINKTDGEYGNDMDAFTAGIGSEAAKLRTIVDPSAASFIAELRRRKKYRVIPADNDVINGIQDTASCLQLGKVKISPCCENLINEMQGYVWDENAAEDRPVKEADHCLTGETLINTPDGEIRIDELVGKSGQVWSYNEETGEAEIKPFFNVRLTQRKSQVYKIHLEDGRIIRCSGDHLILTEHGWVEARYLVLLDKIIDIFGAKKRSVAKTVVVSGIEPDGRADVYNMEVEGNHNFSVNGGLIVHNCMDALRYGVYTMKMVKPKSDYRPLYTR